MDDVFMKSKLKAPKVLFRGMTDVDEWRNGLRIGSELKIISFMSTSFMVVTPMMYCACDTILVLSGMDSHVVYSPT